MYFEIENTPEHVKRARRTACKSEESPKEECPRLVLAPFSRPPQVVFDNVIIGTTCERNLEVINPTKQPQHITLGKALPPGLIVHIPGEWLEVEPESCNILTMVWTPNQPTAVRETLNFTNENHRRHDVIVLLKSVVNVKGKTNQSKGFKISPGKMKRKSSKKSPVAIYKKKTEKINKTIKSNDWVNIKHSTQRNIQTVSEKENNTILNEHSLNSHMEQCPFDSPNSIDFNFNTSEIFSNIRKPNLQDTYDKTYASTDSRYNVPQNVLKPSNRQTHPNTSISDIFDKLTFSPLKTLPAKVVKLDKGPKIVLSVNSDSDFDDSLDLQNNKENEMHSIISITSAQPKRWLTVNHYTQADSQFTETPNMVEKKQPNTSSPKELNSPNFTINTEFSRISDLSFFPQRFSTERKFMPKTNNDTHEIIDDGKLCSDTYTKESPNTPFEQNFNQLRVEQKSLQHLLKEQPKMCRQALFKEFQQREHDRNLLSALEHSPWQSDLRADGRSPPRSITPPLQSIPEESIHLSDTQVLDKTDKQMTTFTINRTFDKLSDKSGLSHSSNNRQTWSKKSIRAEPDLWKVPSLLIKKNKTKTSLRKDSICGKQSNTMYDSNKSINQNLSVNQIGNIYSQSFTVDPFSSATYFYDEEAVDKFETEFKRWLNYILTPPADLDSNTEQKINVGKAWIENRNKEIPAAPTKEQVCSAYHNSHRLESLRRSARTLLMSPDITKVLQKLNAQIEKKLIVIRNDRNLHLDVGLQKIIMEIILSYNPLWLRIGLEATYGTVLPLKSNSDIEGLTTFIIQRMFKNPHLKNKHSKSTAPNMLLPAYMEAVKKFTLKKFFMLVFFLDQAKQRKLISHDPCLFCRNAVCKESREIIIRFTRELIAGIGDITKHLRPLGYVVSHKQSYLDEYKYAVHNIALDIRDGVRLTKVMEIIMMKNGLLNQLRTPAISRLQKIHNVQVALNALKEANFVIVGDITASDIADGHREKTLSLLWQIIHVFRAPLFEKAANIIQLWWRKKYEVIIEKRTEEQRVLRNRNNAANVIQNWWRRIQYNRFVEWQMQKITQSTIVIQKYWRMWLCRKRLLKMKMSVLKIEQWYRCVRLSRQARETLQMLKSQHEQLRQESAIVLQSYVRRWLCTKRYKMVLKNIVTVQSCVRRFVMRRRFLKLKQTAIYVQQKYRGKILMRSEVRRLSEKRNGAVTIQSYFRMNKQRSNYIKIKNAVKCIESRYKALLGMRCERQRYLQLKNSVITLQALYRGKKAHEEFTRIKNVIINLQRRIRANQLMKKERDNFIMIKNATIVIQKHYKARCEMKNVRGVYMKQQTAVKTIQRYFRSYVLAKKQREEYLELLNATVLIQKRYKSLLLMRKERNAFRTLKTATVELQRRYRALIAMRSCKNSYQCLRKATTLLQRRYRALVLMRVQRSEYANLKSSCIKIQNAFRAYVKGKRQREYFIKQKTSAVVIQNWFRSCMKAKEVRHNYSLMRKSCVAIQIYYKAFIIGRQQRQEYLRICTATVRIQRFYRSYLEMRTVRKHYIRLKTATVIVQTYYRSYLETKLQREKFLKLRSAASLIAKYYRSYKETEAIRKRYKVLREATVTLQRRYRSLVQMRKQREQYLKLKQAVKTIETRYRSLLAMKKQRTAYLKLCSAVTVIQTMYRAWRSMVTERRRYQLLRKSCVCIQTRYRANIQCRNDRRKYLHYKNCAIVLQRRYRAQLLMRKTRFDYIRIKKAAIVIQTRYRAYRCMLEHRQTYTRIIESCVKIQKHYRAFLIGRRQREEFLRLKTAAVLIQQRFRAIVQCREIRNEYLRLKTAAIFTQRRFRANKIAFIAKRNEAANKIRNWYISILERNKCRSVFLKLKESAVVIQSFFRMYITRKKYVEIKESIIIIQRFYRSYKLSIMERQRYDKIRHAIIKTQSCVRRYIQRRRYLELRSAAVTIQSAYRLKRHRELVYDQRNTAAICIQKHMRRYIAQSFYTRLRNSAILIQKIWRGKLLTRLMRCNYLQKRTLIIKFQAVIRGYLVRKQVRLQKENIIRMREIERRDWAASRIQALFRGHRVRLAVANDRRVTDLRRRWREGALVSYQETLKERNEEAMDVLRNMCDIETVIRAFRSLELLTEVFPMMYNENASSVVRRVYVYMSVTNRSISSIEVLKSAAAVLVNLTRYRVTGPKIYARDRISPILKFMWRFSNSETQLFCILSSYLWLFAKYQDVKKDLTEYFHLPENHKMLKTIKGNIDRMKRMATNTMKNKYHTPQPTRFVSHTSNQSLNHSVSSNSGCTHLAPALEPDYGILRADKPRYFEDAQHAIHCLFLTYKL